MLAQRSRRSGNWGKVLFIACGAAAAMYLFDPRLGRTRRAGLQGRINSGLRRGAREVTRKSRYARGQLKGIRHLMSSDSAPPNDQALTAKVESEVLTRRRYPKGHISVNACDGVVELRGVADTVEQIAELEQAVRKVTGVLDIHNYLHLHDEPAPNKQHLAQM